MFGFSAFAAIPFGGLTTVNAQATVSGVQTTGQIGPAFVQGVPNAVTAGVFGFGTFADAALVI